MSAVQWIRPGVMYVCGESMKGKGPSNALSVYQRSTPATQYVRILCLCNVSFYPSFHLARRSLTL